MFLDKFFEESRFRRICNSNKQSRGGQISGGKLLLTQPWNNGKSGDKFKSQV